MKFIYELQGMINPYELLIDMQLLIMINNPFFLNTYSMMA